MKRPLYINAASEGYVAAINILAVEFLVKKYDRDEYTKWVNKVYALSEEDLDFLYFRLALNMHTSTLGAMISQGDYEFQRETLFDFLKEVDHEKDILKTDQRLAKFNDKTGTQTR